MKNGFLQFLASRLDEDKKTYLAKYASEPDVTRVVDGFWKIKQRVKAPLNDIDWWINKPFSELKDFVTGFDVRKRSERRSDQYAKKAEANGAKMLGEFMGYELWYVPSYEAAVQLGRFYKNVTVRWCISTDSPDYFNRRYKDSEFVFAIYSDMDSIPYDTPDYYEKLAFQFDLFDDDYDITVWDIQDNSIQHDDDFQAAYLPLQDEARRLLKESGLNRKDYQKKLVEKYVHDEEWLKKNPFSDCYSFKLNSNGSATAEFPIDSLDDVFSSYTWLNANFAKRMLKGEYLHDFDSYNVEIEYDPSEKITQVFDKRAAELGLDLTWKDVLRIRSGLPVTKVNDREYDIVADTLETNFYDGNGYATIYCDAWENGTGKEARSDVMQELGQRIGAVRCEYDENRKDYVLTCVISENMLRHAILNYISGEYNDSALALMLYDEDEEDIDRIIIEEPYAGWSDLDEGMMSEAMAGFAETLYAEFHRQRDLKGQGFFDFDKDYLDNPSNRKTDRLNEANAVGSDFEQEVADGVNSWLKENGLGNKFEAKRFQTVDEAKGVRDEDYSDVIVTEKRTGASFFIECKAAERANVVNAKFELTEDGSLEIMSGCVSEGEENASELENAVKEAEGMAEFRSFMKSPCKALGGEIPLKVWFSKDENTADGKLSNLVKKYNGMVKNGKTEADCKEFNLKKLRKSTKNALAVALAWRVSDENRTWDVCRAELPNMSEMIRGHYSNGKEIPARYIQFGDKLFVLDSAQNPLGLKNVPVFPENISGIFSLKFTPRFGTGSVYLTPRSEITSDLDSDSSFTDKEKWPCV